MFAKTESPQGQPFEPDLGHASEGKRRLFSRILIELQSVAGLQLFFYLMLSQIMRLIINGKERVIQSSLNIQGLLQELDIKVPHVAVAVNSNVIPRTDYEKTPLAENDKIEIVTAVGGGIEP